MPDSTDPNDDRSVILKAIDIAFPIMEADLNTADIVTTLLADGADPLRVLAHAFLSAMNRLHDVGRIAPALFSCGWCHAAAGGGDDAWRALPRMDAAVAKAHTLICEHNPLVVAVNAARAYLAVLDADYDRHSAERRRVSWSARSAALGGAAGDQGGAVMENRIDIDELERKIRDAPAGICYTDIDRTVRDPSCNAIALALIARIRELEDVATQYAGSLDRRSYDGQAAEIRAIIEKGAVLP